MQKFSPEAVFFTPCQYILLFATVIKGITKTIFNTDSQGIFGEAQAQLQPRTPQAEPD